MAETGVKPDGWDDLLSRAMADYTAADPEPTEEQVYVSKTGKRYHKSSKCSGGKYTQVPISEAISRGLTPCKKCAGG